MALCLSALRFIDHKHQHRRFDKRSAIEHSVGNRQVIWGLGNMADGALLIGPTIYEHKHQHRRFDKRSAIEHSVGNRQVIWGLANMADGALLIGSTIYASQTSTS